MDPADMSGGTGGDYHDWTKQQLMLLWFWNKLNEAYDQGWSHLRLAVVQGGPFDAAEISASVPYSESERPDPNTHSRPINISDEVPELSRGGEAVAIFNRLWRENYIDVTGGDSTKSGMPILLNIRTKGLIDIGKFPDPDQRLAQAFAALQRVAVILTHTRHACTVS